MLNNKKSNFEKKYGLPPSCRNPKLSRKIKTVDDLFARDDVTDALNEVAKSKADITDIIIVYKNSDGSAWYSYAINESSDKEQTFKALGMLEYAKNMILNPSKE